MTHSQLIAQTRPPAKLNLFLELLAKRDDGFHEIDTVMVPIDLCDELRVQRTTDASISLDVDWLPSPEIFAQRLGVSLGSDEAAQLLYVPESDDNLVHRALVEFTSVFQVDGGFHCQLRKRIPAGAGMGGASSDAASALLCAAKLCEISPVSPELFEIAAAIGSDVPFFLGQCDGIAPIGAMRARGRGEKLSGVGLATPFSVVVAYPNASLSTAKVYSKSKISDHPASAEEMVAALESGNVRVIQEKLCNALGEPAKIILPRIDEILESMWRSGLPACQLTGSGSACFAITSSVRESLQCAQRLQAMLEPGALVLPATTTTVPAPVLANVVTNHE